MHYNNCISYFFVSNVLGCAGHVCFYYEKKANVKALLNQK